MCFQQNSCSCKSLNSYNQPIIIGISVKVDWIKTTEIHWLIQQTRRWICVSPIMKRCLTEENWEREDEERAREHHKLRNAIERAVILGSRYMRARCTLAAWSRHQSDSSENEYALLCFVKLWACPVRIQQWLQVMWNLYRSNSKLSKYILTAIMTQFLFAVLHIKRRN